MGVTYQTKTETGESQLATAVDTIVDPALVDEFLALDAKLTKHAEKVKVEQARYEELKKQLVALVDETQPADTSVDLKGTDPKKGYIEISAKGNQTTFLEGGVEQAKKYLGKDEFFRLAKITITDAKDYLTKPQFQQITTTAQTGPRRLKIK